jgi:hypothetical protein
MQNESVWGRGWGKEAVNVELISMNHQSLAKTRCARFQVFFRDRKLTDDVRVEEKFHFHVQKHFPFVFPFRFRDLCQDDSRRLGWMMNRGAHVFLHAN